MYSFSICNSTNINQPYRIVVPNAQKLIKSAINRKSESLSLSPKLVIGVEDYFHLLKEIPWKR